MSARGEAAPRADGRARDALRSTHHLACVRGPDTGIVIPLPCDLGRGDDSPLEDRSVSRLHARVSSVSGAPDRWALEDLGSLNGTFLRSRRRRRLDPEGPRRVRGGERILIGEDVLVVRGRPAALEARVGPERGARRLLLVLPLVSLLLFAARSLAPIGLVAPGRGFGALLLLSAFVAAAVLLVRLVRRRASRPPRDDAGIALVLARLAASAPSSPSGSGGRRAMGSPEEPIRLRLARSGGGGWGPRLDLGSPSAPRSLCVLGEGARSDAHRIAARLVVALGGGRLRIEGRSLVFGERTADVEVCEPDAPPRSDTEGPRWRIAWAQDLASAPEWAELLVPATGAPLASRFWEQFGAEDPLSSLPDSIGLAPLLAEASPGEAHRSLAAPIGVDASGPLVLDLVADGPHALLAGATGSGKSEALLAWISAMAALHPPSEVRFVLFDHKGGSAFAPLRGLPHVDRVLTDLAEEATGRALRALSALLARRERDLAALALPDYETWARRHREGARPAPPPRIVVVIDEFRVLAESHGAGVAALVRLAAQGRSLGLHLIVSTQRPGGAVSQEMRANIDLRIALRCLSPADSIDVLSEPGAASLPRRPGRALIAGRGVVQFARLDRSRLAALASPGEEADPLPWAPDVPTRPSSAELDALEDAGGAGIGIGIVDGIDEGAHRLLVWRGERIALVGPASAGRVVLEQGFSVARRLAKRSESPLHACLPAGGSPPSSFRAGATTLVDVEDAEGVALLLSEAAASTPCVLLLGDLARIRASLASSFGALGAEALLEEGIEECRRAGVALVVAAPGVRASDRLLAACETRIELPDPHDPIAPRDRARDPLPSGLWGLAGPEGEREAVALVRGPDEFGLEEARRRDGGGSGSPSALVLPWEKTASRAPGPALLAGPRWESIRPPERGRVLVLGDEERRFDALSRSADASEEHGRIEHLPSASWTRALGEESAHLVLLDPPPDALRALARSANPLPTAISGRKRAPGTGVARFDGHWERIGIAVSSRGT